MDSTIARKIAQETAVYVGLCRLAAYHDENENLYKAAAHIIFYDLQELKTKLYRSFK